MASPVCARAFRWRSALAALTLACPLFGAQAALFEDDEARKAILELRQRVDALRTQSTSGIDALTQSTAADRQALAADLDQLRAGLVALQREIETLRGQVAQLRGAQEEVLKASSDLQRVQRDELQALRDRLARLEPIKVSVDGIEFNAEPAEKAQYETALAAFRKGDFVGAQPLLVAFVARYPGSGYVTPALFWLGNAQYATRDYKEAIANFRALVARSPEHLRAPEAVLSIANCQLELKDLKGARKTLTDLMKAYPASEAAAAAKERLAALK